MQNTTSLPFITERIRNLNTAVMHCHSNQVLKIKSTVIDTTHVDELGNVWFYIEKPPQQVNEFEREFPVALNYFKKGCPYYINIFGLARIIIEPEELVECMVDESLNLQPATVENKILLRVKISNVNYYGNEPVEKTSLMERFKNTVIHWLLPSDNYKPVYSERGGHYA